MTLTSDAAAPPAQDSAPAPADRAPASDSTCCTPLVRESLDPSAAAETARAFKALADPARLRLLSLVTARAGGEACVCDLTEPLGLSQPTVSHHLKILVESGLLAREQRGRWAYYSLVPAGLDRLRALLTETTG